MKKVQLKKRNILLITLVSLMFIVLAIYYVSAADVAYIYKSKPKIDQNVLDIFNELNLTYDTINERNMPRNFSSYRFLYVGNERFSKNIPVNDYPVVITNYFFGNKWGLTDRDGISKLAATSPLQVLKNGQIIQVYTQARYNNRPISLPYFYLGNEDKVPAMQKIAGTYMGNEGYDIGDVISFASAGTHLINGKDAKGNVCFYGIVESDYWTEDARDMFLDCVDRVANVCSNNNDCPSELVGDKYCINKSVYRDITRYRCENPGTIHSICIGETETELIEECADLCVNGECKDVTCFNNSECGADGFIDRFCQNDDVFGNYIIYTCNSPGTTLSFCSNSSDIRLIENCSAICVNGECRTGIHDVSFIDFTGSINKIKLEYANNTDINESIPVLNCEDIIKAKIKIKNNGDFSENVTITGTIDGKTINFNNINNLAPGDTSERNSLTPYINLSFASGTYNITIQAMIINDTNPSDNKAVRQVIIDCPECRTDNDCPGDYCSTDLFCIGNNVFCENHDFSCILGRCIENISNHLVNTCVDVCVDGECQNIECFNNSECGTNGYLGNKYCMNNDSYQDYRSFTCTNPGTPESRCSNTTTPVLIEYCDLTCINGDCITCFNDLNCGIDGYIGDKYCINDSVYQDYKEFDCLNPGTALSSCSTRVSQRLIEECADVCLNGACRNITCKNDSDCDDQNISTIDKCINPNTISSYCTHTPVNCINDADCGLTGFTGQEFCFSNDIFKNFLNSTCNNPGTINSYCVLSLNQRLVDDCGEDSCTNFENNYCNGNDVYKKRTCYDRGCSNNSCFENSRIDEVLVEHCSESCQNGNCIDITCTSDSDCGTNGYIGNNFCSSDDVFQNYITYTCNNAGTSLSSCSNSTDTMLRLDCGDDSCGNFGDNYCKNNDVYKKRTCHDRGCNNSNCFDNINNEEVLVQDCAELCSSGECAEITCHNDSECDDNIVYTIDNCVHPNTISSYCTHTPVNCLNDADCGITGFTGDEFCFSDDIFKYFQTSICNNPGTTNSYCILSLNPRLINECGVDSCTPFGDNYCKGNDVYKKRTCTDKGCFENACIEDLWIDEVLVEECSESCTNGDCINISCNRNSDCGSSGYVGDNYCNNDDLYKDYLEYICNFPGTSLSYCSDSTTFNFIQDCGVDSCSSYDDPYCKGDDLYQNKSCTSKGCTEPEILNNGLIAYFTFDNGFIDSSGNSNNAVCSPSSSCPTMTNGIKEKAYSFDGVDDSLTFPINNLVLKKFAISSWFKTNYGGTLSAIESRTLSNPGGSGIGLNNDTGKITGIIADSSEIKDYTQTENSYLDNAWHNAIITYDGTILSLYVDGKLKDAKTVNYDINGLSTFGRIGIGTGVHLGYFKGIIDEVRVYDKSLSQNEVLNIYNLGTQDYSQCYENSYIEEDLYRECEYSCRNNECNQICLELLGTVDAHTAIPIEIASGVKFHSISSVVQDDSTYVLKLEVENLDGVTKTMVHQTQNCRCWQHLGDNPRGECNSYYNGNKNVPGTCLQLPEATVTLAPFEKKVITMPISQYDNEICGRYQIDMLWKQINSDIFDRWRLVSFAVVDMCEDCL